MSPIPRSQQPETNVNFQSEAEERGSGEEQPETYVWSTESKPTQRGTEYQTTSQPTRPKCKKTESGEKGIHDLRKG